MTAAPKGSIYINPVGLAGEIFEDFWQKDRKMSASFHLLLNPQISQCLTHALEILL